MNLQFDTRNAAAFISADEYDYMKKQVLGARETLVTGTGAGNDFLGLSLIHI